MSGSEAVIAVDWGTTNRRAYRLDAAGGITGKMEDEAGVFATPAREFAAAAEALRSRLGGGRLLMAGMIGSNRGWVEAPYVPCPATLEDVAARLASTPGGEGLIVPGLSFVGRDRADVMRGEETQVLGALALGRIDADAFVCHPGTHAKWVELRSGAVIGFRTVMTGELFALLRAHGTLAAMIDGEVEVGPDFLHGVARGFEGAELGAELFGVRAAVLLGRMDKAQAAPFTSGMLIGADLRAGLQGGEGREVAVVGGATLTRLYAAALEHCGRSCRTIDGEEAFVAGMRAIAEARP